jgi:4'-phosphopantetheinyl transferase
MTKNPGAGTTVDGTTAATGILGTGTTVADGTATPVDATTSATDTTVDATTSATETTVDAATPTSVDAATGTAMGATGAGVGGGPVVEVWWARIDQVRREFVEDLDEVELGRLAAYVRDEDKDRFLLGVTLTRRLLGRRFSLPPAKVVLDRTCLECGKPHGKVRADGVELSVTHSGDLVGVAICECPVGIDVEKVDPQLDVDGVAGMALSPEELQDLNRHTGLEKVQTFMTYWTRKEAVVKATGEGLRANLRRVSGKDAVLTVAGEGLRPELRNVSSKPAANPGVESPSDRLGIARAADSGPSDAQLHELAETPDDPTARAAGQVHELAVGPGCRAAIPVREVTVEPDDPTAIQIPELAVGPDHRAVVQAGELDVRLGERAAVHVDELAVGSDRRVADLVDELVGGPGQRVVVQVQELAVGVGYRGALAVVSGEVPIVRVWEAGQLLV